MEVKTVLALIDKNIDYLDELYKDFNVLLSKVSGSKWSKVIFMIKIIAIFNLEVLISFRLEQCS